MPLGKSPLLQNDLMAEGDNNKHLLFNDALVALEDSVNRLYEVDLAGDNVTLTQTQMTRYGVFRCTGHTVARSLQLPIALGTDLVATQRVFAVRNEGTGAVTVTTNNGGADVIIGAGSTGLLYTDATDVISLGGVANAATIPLNKDGVEVVARLLSLNFAGEGFTITDDGNGAATVTYTPPSLALLGLSDTPTSYAGEAGKLLAINLTENGIEFVDPSEAAMSAEQVKTAYESNADTNAFTDAEQAKLAGIEAGATGDMTAAEIKTSYESNSNTNAFTDAEKSKLASLEESLFKGTFTSLTALDTAYPLADAGSYAYVDPGIGEAAAIYIWDDDDSTWRQGGGSGTSETPATVKSKYESNADTNAFTDAEKTKLAGIEDGATGDLTAEEIEAALDTYYGNTDWRTGGGGSMSAADIEAALDSYYGNTDWRTGGSGGGETTYLSFPEVYGNETAETSTSSSNYATKGNILSPQNDRTLIQVESYAAAGQTLQLVIAELASSNPGQITEVLYTSDPLVVSTTGEISFSLAEPLALTAGTSYAFMLTRTDGTATSGAGVPFPGGSGFADPNGNWTWQAAIRYASISPQVGDNTYYATSTSVRMVLKDTDGAAALLLAGGGSMSAEDIEAALDAYYGNTDWRTGGTGGGAEMSDPIALNVVNGDFETGDGTGWTTTTGTLVCGLSYSAEFAGAGASTQDNGEYVARGGAQSRNIFHQDVDISGVVAEGVAFTLTADAYITEADDDTLTLTLELLDAGNAVLATTSYVNADPVITHDEVSLSLDAVTGAVTARITVDFDRNTGTDAGLGIDNIALSYTTPLPPMSAEDIEAALDAYYGNTDWRTPGTGGGGTVTPTKKTLLSTSTNQTIPASTLTQMTFDAVEEDSGDFYSAGSPNQFTIPAGVTAVLVTASWRVDANVNDLAVETVFRKNGATETYDRRDVSGWGGATISQILSVEEGDVITFHLFGTAGFTNRAAGTRFSILDLTSVSGAGGGGDTIAYDAKVGRAYWPDTSPPSSGVWNSIPFGTVAVDDLSFFDVLANPARMTIPAGVSRIRINVSLWETSTASSGSSQFRLFKNGSIMGVSDGGFNIEPDRSGGYNNSGMFGESAVLDVVEGDYFEIKQFASNTSQNSEGWAEIEVVTGAVLGGGSGDGDITLNKNFLVPYNFYQSTTLTTGTAASYSSKGVLLAVTQTQVVISLGTYFPDAGQTIVAQVFEVDTVESPSIVQSLVYQSDPFVTEATTMAIATPGLTLEAGKSYYLAWTYASGGGTQAISVSYTAENPEAASWISGRNGGRIALDASGNFIGQDVYYDPSDHYRFDITSYPESARAIIAGGVAGPQGAQGPQGPAGPAGADGAGTLVLSEDTAADHAVTNADLLGNQFLKLNYPTAQTVTVTAGLTGTEPLTVVQTGSGQVTFVPDAGVTINSAGGLLSLRAQYSSATLVPDGADNFYLIGDLA
ncbi:hypothetical protein RPALISO_70 [Ruegeria phage RpAliso]|nr:hypothetical protein RPALISO_70 [Ruegeria phage RpAliso]